MLGSSSRIVLTKPWICLFSGLVTSNREPLGQPEDTLVGADQILEHRPMLFFNGREEW